MTGTFVDPFHSHESLTCVPYAWSEFLRTLDRVRALPLSADRHPRDTVVLREAIQDLEREIRTMNAFLDSDVPVQGEPIVLFREETDWILAFDPADLAKDTVRFVADVSALVQRMRAHYNTLVKQDKVNRSAVSQSHLPPKDHYLHVKTRFVARPTAQKMRQVTPFPEPLDFYS